MIVTVVAISESVRYSPFFCAAHGGLEATSGRTGMSRPRCCGRGGFLTVDRGQPHRLALLPGTARATFSSLYAEC